MKSNHCQFSHKTTQIKTLGSPCSRLSIAELWGPKFLDNIVDLDINFEFEREKSTVKRLLTFVFRLAQLDPTEYSLRQDESPIPVQVKGLISKLAVGCGRTSTDRQFFYVNGRPCNLHAVRAFAVEPTGLVTELKYRYRRLSMKFIDHLMPTKHPSSSPTWSFRLVCFVANTFLLGGADWMSQIHTMSMLVLTREQS